MDKIANPSISIVVPVYNSANTLETLTNRLGAVLPNLTDNYEVIFVNDGSRDNSWDEIQRLSQVFPFVVGINLMRNYGQHNALLCGTRSASYDIVVTMDDDLQHPPEEITDLIAKLAEGFDVVYGTPKKMPHSFFRNLASRLTKVLIAMVMGIKTIREIGSFRAFRTNLRQAFAAYQSPGVILDVLLSWGTTRFASINVEENKREIGKSNYTLGKLIGQAFLVLTGYSTVPLRFASWIGFGFTIFGIIIFLYVVILYLTKGSIPGFPFLASIISLFSGTQLFALGIMGEYLAQVFDRSTDRPIYMVGEIIRNNRN
jgi:undecaprenyl-phosphate 4-deoxy-4-formamido-L-arabinose transferase